MSELETRAQQLKAVSEFGLEALARPGFAVLRDRAVEMVAAALRAEIVTVDELQADGGLVVRAAVGLGPVVAEGERVPAGEGSLAGHTLLAGHPVIVGDLPAERGPALRPSFLRAGAKSSLSVAIGPSEQPWGVLIAATTSARDFSHDDVAFMQGVSNVLGSAFRFEQAEISLRVSEELFRGGFEHSPIGMTLVDTDGVLKEANASFARILGYPDPDDLAGLRIASITHPDDAIRDQAVIQQMVDGEYPSRTAEKRYIRKDGAVCHAIVSSTLVHVGAADASLFFTQVEDVTEAKLAQRELQRLADAAEQGSDAIISFDLDNRIRHWNRGAERLFDIAADQAIGMSMDEMNALTDQSEETGLRGKAVIDKALAGGPVRAETQRRHTDGTLWNLSVSVTPWRVDGQVVGVTSTVTDITAHKQADQAMARLAAIVEGSDDAIIGKTLEGTITSWNPSAERIYGYTAADAVGQNISLLAPPERELEFEQIMASVRSGVAVAHLETTRRCKDGRLIEVSITVSPVRDASGAIVGAATVARDITEQKQNERAREQTLRNLAEAQHLAKLGSWTWDPSLDEATWSQQMYEIFGRDPADGPATSEQLFAYIHPDDRDRIVAGYTDAFGSGSGFELAYRIVSGDGIERHLRGLGYADSGRPGCYVGTVQDVTDQREAEQERIEMLEATARAEGANRAKSEFLARMSHELRTPLNSIIGFSQLMELEGLEPRQQKHVSLVLKAARHLLELINEVLDLARIEAGRLAVSPEPVALVGAIEEAIELVLPLASERNVTVHADITGIADDCHVSADSNRLKQVLLNLLSNAIKYNRDGGQVKVSLATTTGGRLRVRIADTGIGIRADQLPKLFEPFERLGAEQTEIEGTGLGLSLCRALVEAMRGTIEVESDAGEGSTFVIELAAAHRPDAGPDQPRPDEHLQELGSAPDERRRILYIEDNFSNLTLVEQILERYPAIQLVSAMQGSLGLDLARQHRPDLIILDLHLPDMSGLEVLKRLKGEHATIDVPVVMLTADASKTQAEHARLLGASDYLTKPLDVGSFIDVIAGHLSRLDDRPDSG